MILRRWSLYQDGVEVDRFWRGRTARRFALAARLGALRLLHAGEIDRAERYYVLDRETGDTWIPFDQPVDGRRVFRAG